MRFTITTIMLLVAIVLAVMAGPASGMDPDAVVRLKEAGAGDAVLAALVREKSLETAAFTVDELVKMK